MRILVHDRSYGIGLLFVREGNANMDAKNSNINMGSPSDTPDSVPVKKDFIREKVASDLQAGKHGGKVVTRFPPEPNGYLHIGHAKSICLNFGIALENQGTCHLRFDDTNPIRENVEYVDSIQEDVRWLGFDWHDKLFFASDYFEQLYDFAVGLIKKGRAFVCDLNAEEFKSTRGTPTQPGTNSPWRDRSIDENLDLFQRMRAGEFDNGTRTLRAKIDMASTNIHMRDPALYRIRKVHHHRTGDQWCIYPTYDFTHCLSDSIERVTHSVCTLEFEVHRPLYDWILDACETPCHPQQIEFARLNLAYTLMSKRKLLTMVENRWVQGWDDPRMPTLSGLRRRGYTPDSIRHFCSQIGVTRFNGLTDMAVLEKSIRDDLNKSANRVLGVLRPLKLVIENWPTNHVEELDAVNNPEDPTAGTRKLPFTGELYIEKDDFMENPQGKFFRLKPGGEVRLRYAYIIRCERIIKDETSGEIIELRCTYDPDTRSGGPAAGRKVKGTIHWVSAHHNLQAEVRLYDRLLTVADPDAEAGDRDWSEYLNPNSLEVLKDCRIERSLTEAKGGERYQFERLGYFYVDPMDSRPGQPVFNRTVPLKDSWAKLSQAQ